MPHFPFHAGVDRLIIASRSVLGRKRRRSRRVFFLGVESLEERALLATVTVDIVDDAFTPAATTIQVGDTVHWVWIGSDHSTTSVSGIAESWNSGVNSAGFTFDHTFTKAGAFPYYCMIHGFDQGNGTAGGMSGVITVSAATGTATLQSIAVTPVNSSVGAGKTQQFAATGTFSDNTTQNLTSQVTWASASTTVATISAAGLATGVAAGTSTITASMNGVTGSTALTVTAPTLQSIAVTPAGSSIGAGKTQQFAATGTFSDNTTQNLTSQVTWTSSSTAVATISAAGLATGVAAGTSTITASLSGMTGSTGLTVTAAAATLQSIAVSPAGSSIGAGKTQQFAATGTFSDNTTQNLTSQVTWTSSSTAVATISAAGLATGVAAGTSTITASFSGVTGTTPLSVTAAVATLQSIAVTPAGSSIGAGKTQQFAATGTFSDNTTQNLTSQVTWTSSSTGVATISAAGLASGVDAVTSTITASLSGVTGTTALSVTAATLQSIAVTPANPSVARGATQQFTATGTFSDNSTQNLTSQVTWVSSSTTVATISAAGLATGVAAGTSTITASLSGVTGSTALTINAVAATLQSIAVTPANPSVFRGSTQQFTATGTFSDNSTQNLTSQVTWVSSSTTVATISAAGLATGVATGTSTITASLSGATGTTALSVAVPTLQSITLTPGVSSIVPGASQQFIATGVLSDGSTESLAGQATWVSSSTAVATISAAGLATGVALGTSTITASFSGVTGSTTLTVSTVTLTLQSIVVTPANSSIGPGTSQLFTATGRFSDNSTQDLTSQVTWASAIPSVATISATGFATGGSTGTTTITASLNGVTASTALMVTPLATNLLQSILVTPADTSLGKGGTVRFTASGNFSDGSTQDLTSRVTWASTNPGVATISAAGLAAGVSGGATTISATLSGVSGGTRLTVTAVAVALRSIAVTPASPLLVEGATQQFSAIGTFSDGSTQDLTNQVTWASASPSVATINTSGLAAAARPGSASITASLNSVSSSAVLTVTSAQLVSIALTLASPSLTNGRTEPVIATGTFADSTTSDLSSLVSWTSLTPTVASISSTGVATALAPGTATIVATLSGISGRTVLTVAPLVLQTIKLMPPNPTIGPGNTEPFTATGTFSDGSTQDLTGQVTWASANSAVATITAAGLATGSADGTATITAALGSVTGQTGLTVSPAILQSILVSPASPTIAKGQTISFTATGTFSDNSIRDVTNQVSWASANPAVATVSAAGLATGLAPGTAAIIATLGDVTGSRVLTAGPAVLESIAVTPANPSVAKGNTEPLVATGILSDNSTQDLTSQVSWTSATNTVATVSVAGVATAVASGTTTITATLAGMTGQTVLTVVPAALLSIVVTPAGPSLPDGETEAFAATGTFSDNTTSDLTAQVTWASATTSVATINGAGQATGVAPGTSSISATLDGVTGQTMLTVSPAVLQSIAVTPANPSVPKGETMVLDVTGTFSDGTVQDLTSQVSWASASSSVATISAGGVASGLALGASTIAATLGGVTGQTVLTVSPAVPLSIVVTPANSTIAKGDAEPFTATGAFSDGANEDVTSQVTWASSTATVATISGAGLATGLAPGTSTITATLSGVSGQALLTVGPAVLRSIALTPANTIVAAGATDPFIATGTLSDNSTEDVTSQVIWTSATPAVATVSTAGVATGLAAGTATISATSAGVIGQAVLTVSPAALLSIAVTSAAPSIAKGTTEPFIATGTFSDSTTQDLTGSVVWTSASPAFATISAAGLATGLAPGTSTITAAFGGITGLSVLTVSAAALESIALTPAAPSIAKGTTEPFIATGTFTDGTTKGLTGQVTWASATPTVATISAAGLATGVGPGTSSITAALGSITGTTVMIVGPAILETIVVTPANPSVAKGATEPLTATGTFSDDSIEDLTSQVTWASATSTVATINADGVATGVAPGTASISATLAGTTGKAVLSVGPAALRSITVTRANPSIPKGGTEPFSATGTLTDNTTEDLTDQVSWTSGTSTVATIDAAGVATGLATGTATITAGLDGVAGSSTLTVSAAALQSIAVTRGNAGIPIPKGDAEPFTATGAFSDDSRQDLTGEVSWASATPSVATISANGVATGLAPGTATITATLAGISGQAIVPVSPAVLQSIVVKSASSSVIKGDSDAFTATGILSDNSTEDLTGQVNWASATPFVAAISANGVATGLTAGTATISASQAGVTGQAVLTVSPAVLQSIAVMPANASIPKEGTETFTALGIFSDDSTQDLTTQVTWASASGSVATISATGVATGLAQGQSSITATLGALTGQAMLTVSPAVLQTITVIPNTASIAAGETESFIAIGAFSDSSTQDLTSQVVWASATTSVASISASGLATGLAPGSSFISARLGSASGLAVLTVTVSATPSPITAPAPTPNPAPSPTPASTFTPLTAPTQAATPTPTLTPTPTSAPAIPNPLFVASGLKLRAAVDKRIHGIVANFKEPGTTRSDFQATIDWGDQSETTPGQIAIHGHSKGQFAVVGSHRYARTGVYTITITVQDEAGDMIEARSLVHVIM